MYRGEIPEASVTYNVVGNTNERGLVIAETTYGGAPILGSRYQPDGVLDYGSLIYVALQRSRTARDAIGTMTSLLDEHGYASSGESFSLADASGEVWILEVIGRGGTGRRGAAWVARRVPDGAVSAHANQARITTFPRDDPENCLYSDDVVDLAVSVGLYNRTSGSRDNEEDADFSFSDVYDPVTFLGARACEARVWSVFRAISDDPSFGDRYANYAAGRNLTNRMPLWITPKKVLDLSDVAELMSSHYESSPLAFDSDVGAGAHSAPYRPRPLEWKYGDGTYVNERAVATQQTGWNFIGQVRTTVPPPLTSLLWFGVDDSSTSPRYPVYGCSTWVSAAYGGLGTQDGVRAPVLDFDLTKAFWVQNMVSNLAYSRWDEVYPVVREKIHDIADAHAAEVEQIDRRALDMKSEEAVEFVTSYSVAAGNALHSDWLTFYGALFARFRDGYDIVPKEDNVQCGCDIRTPGLSDGWRDRIVKETGSQYKVIGDSGGGDHSDPTDDDDDGPVDWRTSLDGVGGVMDSKLDLVALK